MSSTTRTPSRSASSSAVRAVRYLVLIALFAAAVIGGAAIYLAGHGAVGLVVALVGAGAVGAVAQRRS